jgi:hypothetical protein
MSRYARGGGQWYALCCGGPKNSTATDFGSMQQIADWLKKLRVSEYVERFAENEIDVAVLPDLTDQHLKDIGVSFGHRLKMPRALRDLGGAPIAVTAPSAPVAIQPTQRGEAERRQLTVMFCDPVGSTAPWANLDPEELYGINTAYHCCYTEQVERNSGFVAKYMGEGVRVRPRDATFRRSRLVSTHTCLCEQPSQPGVSIRAPKTELASPPGAALVGAVITGI